MIDDCILDIVLDKFQEIICIAKFDNIKILIQMINCQVILLFKKL